MKTENNKALQLLVNKVIAIANSHTIKSNYDKTFKSTVWNVNEDGTYQISYLNQPYDVPNALGTPLIAGQSVWVKIPCGILRNMHICGINNKKID